MSVPPTRHLSYPIGIRLAWLGSKIGLSPNTVSWLAFLVGIISAVAAGWWIDDSLGGAAVLLVGLQLSYALDCADGVTARATNRCTPFGALLDKVLDGMVILLVPMILARGARLHGWVEPLHVSALIAISTVPRLALALTNWMKAYETGSVNARNSPDTRQRTLTQLAARVIAGILDTPTYSLGIALSWWLGWYVPFAVCFGGFTLLAFAFYLVKSAREM